MSKTMEDVLAEHQWYDATNDREDPATGCTGCDDWFGSEGAPDDGTFAAHQAAALSAAGFGVKLDDATVERAAEVLISGPEWCECRRSPFDKHDVNPPCPTRRQATELARAVLAAAVGADQ